jgi:hypothetical protein
MAGLHEAAVMRHNPAKASQLARDTIPQHTGGADRGQDIRPDDRTRAAEAQFATETRADQRAVNSEQNKTREDAKDSHLQGDAGKTTLNNKPQQQQSEGPAKDLVVDINEFVQTQLFNWNPGYFDILWASPPCTEYSYAKSIGERDLDKVDKMVASALACLI